MLFKTELRSTLLRLCYSKLSASILILRSTMMRQTLPSQNKSHQNTAELRHYYSGHIYANPSQRATKLYCSIAVLILTTQRHFIAMRDLSLLCLCKLLYANQCRSVTTQCISYPIYAFALPIITTFIHAVAYSVISVHVYRPFPELRH